MKKLFIILPILILLSVPVYAQDERLDALDFWAVETFEDAEKVCEFYAEYSDYEYILEDLSENDWNNIEDALMFYDEYGNTDMDDYYNYIDSSSKNIQKSDLSFVPIIIACAIFLFATPYIFRRR